MKLRNDSQFACLSRTEQLMVLELAEEHTVQDVMLHIERMHPGVDFSIPGLKRLIRRLREEEMRAEVEESDEAMEALANAGRNGRARDGMVEAMRRKLYAQGLEAKSPMEATMFFKMMQSEQTEDRKLKLEERRMALEERNAEQEWRARELEAAASALKLLPRIRELLCEESEGTAEERLARARQLLMVGGGAALLAEKVTRTED